MDDAFTLNCRPTVPVGCEEQVDIKVYRLFSFSSYHLKAFDDYVTLHNLHVSMLLTYIVTLYHIQCGCGNHFIYILAYQD